VLKPCLAESCCIKLLTARSSSNLDFRDSHSASALARDSIPLNMFTATNCLVNCRGRCKDGVWKGGVLWVAEYTSVEKA